ncbi:MAG: hypothetical protein MRK01_02115 [Candidatus Scalindua sp.]|nr:hypothetical protein [Candidatus Scalindua sp.]
MESVPVTKSAHLIAKGQFQFVRRDSGHMAIPVVWFLIFIRIAGIGMLFR